MKLSESGRMRRVLILAAAASLSAVRVSAVAGTTVWSAPVDGNWFDSTKWQPNAAPNGGSTDAVINATGQLYKVTADRLVRARSITLDSPDASLLLAQLDPGNPDMMSGGVTVNQGILDLQGSIANTPIVVTGGDLRLGPFSHVLGGSITSTNGHVVSIGKPGTAMNSILDSVTFAGAAALIDPQAQLVIHDQFTLNGRLSIVSGSKLVLETSLASPNPELQGTGEIVFDETAAARGDNALIQPSAVLSMTIGPGITIHSGTAGGQIGNSSGFITVNNYGTISGRTQGHTVTLNCRTLNNHGILEASNGGRLDVLGGWTNYGTIRAMSGGTVNLGGFFSLTSSSSIVNTGGVVNITGTLTNTDSTFELNSSTGSVNLAGGTISGGRIASRDGSPLFASPKTTSTLADVLVDADITLDDATLNLSGSVRFSGPRTLLLTNHTTSSTIQASNGFGLDPGGQIIFHGPSLNSVVSNKTLTLSHNTAVRTGTGGGTISASSMLLSQGLLSAETPGQMLGVSGNPIRNEGTIQAINGSTLQLSLTPDWSNAGVLRIVNSKLMLYGNYSVGTLGPFERINSTVQLGGTIHNENDTLPLSAFGGWSFAGAAHLIGGTLGAKEDAGISLTLPPMTLEDVTLALPVTTGQQVALVAGLHLGAQTFSLRSASARATLISSGDVMIAGPGEIVFEGAGTPEGLILPQRGTLTIESGVVVRTGQRSGGIGNSSVGTAAVVNRGVLSGQGAGRTLTLFGQNLSNQGVIEARDGGSVMFSEWSTLTNLKQAILSGGRYAVYDHSSILGLPLIETNRAEIILSGPDSRFDAVGSLQVNSGRLSLLAGKTFVTNVGFINHGEVFVSAESTLSVSGKFIQSPSGLLRLELGQDSFSPSTPPLDALKAVQLAGALEIVAGAGFSPRIGDSYLLMTAPAISGSFDTVELPRSDAWQMRLDYSQTGLSLVVVPEPGFVSSVMASSVPLLIGRSLRRRRRTV